MNRRGLLIAGTAGVASTLLGHSLWAQSGASGPLPRSRPIHFDFDGSKLEPSDFVWEPKLSPHGPVVIVASIPEQLVHVYRNGIEIGLSTCSTGKPGHGTSTGVFVILQKDKDHRSSTYNNAPMPNMQRLTWDGIALHAGNLPGYPASHGCVRLPRLFSEVIFDVTHLGVPVIVADDKSEPEDVVHPGLLLPASAEAEAAEAVLAAESKSKQQDDLNIASAIVSSADRRVLLLVGGRVAWESPIEIDDPDEPLGDHAYTLLGPTVDGSSFRWVAHGLGSEQIVEGRRDTVLSRIRIARADEARRLLASAAIGSTLVVTDAASTA